MNYYFEVLKKYAVFEGRARRAEYWYFVLFNLIVSLVLSYSGSRIMGESGEDLANIYQVAVLIPSLAVAVRRMHDVNKSGWFILIPLYNLVLATREGTKGANKYGPDPKSPEVKEAESAQEDKKYCEKCGNPTVDGKDCEHCQKV